MSYVAEGVLGVVVGIFLLVFLVFGGLLAIAGMIAIVFGVITLAIGASNEAPGHHPDRCGLLGHDWRTNMSALYPGTRCRNCLRIKGQPAVAYVPMTPALYYQATAAPGYSMPGYAPLGAPGYAPAALVAPAAPSPMVRAAYAPPIQQLICPACNSPVQAGMQFCPWCNRPFA